MKKIVLAALATTLFAGAASAQTTSVEIPLSGTLAKRCTISAFLNGPFNVLNLESTASQGAESLTTNCNYTGSNFVKLSSANGGSLNNGANKVNYKFSLNDGTAGFVSLATPVTVEYGKGSPANDNYTRRMDVQLDAKATVAGTYTDTVTAEVTPN